MLVSGRGGGQESFMTYHTWPGVKVGNILVEFSDNVPLVSGGTQTCKEAVTVCLEEPQHMLIPKK